MVLCKRLEYVLWLHLLDAHGKRRDKLEPGVLVPGVPPPAEYSRNYQSVPQPGLNNKPQAVNSAAVVGGGTVINGMFFNRGSAGDYDNWANLGNPGWGWKDLLPYFKKVGPRQHIHVWGSTPVFALYWVPVTQSTKRSTSYPLRAST